MKKTPFVWLGANRARKWPVGEKALLLDKAAHAGLPVPSGAILLDELFEVFLEAGVVVTSTKLSADVTDIDADWLFESLYDGIRFPRFEKPVILRSAFSAIAEDQRPVASGAKFGVDMNDPDELARALRCVWSVSPDPGVAFRRDVLVMEMVKGDVGGTAVTTRLSADVTGSESLIDLITTQDSSFELSQRTGFFPRGDSRLPAHIQRLQKLLGGIRRTFGQGSWQVNWLDDGEICWVVKVAELQSGKVAE